MKKGKYIYGSDDRIICIKYGEKLAVKMIKKINSQDDCVAYEDSDGFDVDG